MKILQNIKRKLMSKYKIRISKSYKTARKKLNTLDLDLLDIVVETLANGEKLDKNI